MRFIKVFIGLFLLIIVFGIFSVKTVSAATVTISGKVSDSSGTGIENVSISVTDAVSGATAGNTTTDTWGNYSLPI